MRLRSLDLVALAIPLLLASCATGKGVAFTGCISDPLTQAILCKVPVAGVFPLGCVPSDPAVQDECDIPWIGTENYICMPPADFKTLFEESRKR